MTRIHFFFFAVACVGFAPACSAGPHDDVPEPTRAPAAAAPARGVTARAHVEERSAGVAQRVHAAEPQWQPQPAPALVDEDRNCAKEGSDAKAGPETTVEEVAIGRSPVHGSARAPVTIVVFADYQCPYCAKAEKTIRALEERYGSDVRVVFKNLALPMHPDARLAAKAGLAANRQGKFWEYHDALFEHQVELDRASLEAYAEDVGLDLARFRADLDSDAVDAELAEEAAEASRLGVRGTPTFFVNGRRLTGAQPLDVFRGHIDGALRR